MQLMNITNRIKYVIYYIRYLSFMKAKLIDSWFMLNFWKINDFFNSEIRKKNDIIVSFRISIEEYL